MTDDQSDDRMDRARRIREMREGSRPEEQADDHADDDAGADPDGADGESEPEAGPGADDRSGGEAGSGGDPEATGDEFPGDWEGATGASAGGDGESPAAEGADPEGEEPFEDGVPQIPGVDMEDTSVDATELSQQAGLSTGDAGAADAAGAPLGGAGAAGAGASVAGTEAAGAGGDAEPAGPVGMAGASDARRRSVSENETRVLEFALGDERYCLDIEYVEEIVKRETVTRVPNTPDYVEGVVDLRGQITTILDPKELFDIDVEGSEELIVVFDPDDFEDQGAIGWLVDDVNQVMPVADSEVNESPVDQKHVNGVVDRDGDFVIWTRPELAVEDAAG